MKDLVSANTDLPGPSTALPLPPPLPLPLPIPAIVNKNLSLCRISLTVLISTPVQTQQIHRLYFLLEPVCSVHDESFALSTLLLHE
jgi:hypothetical protein